MHASVALSLALVARPPANEAHQLAAMEGKSVLVTGGTGYIGSHTVLALLEAGASVVILDNLVNSCEEVLPRLRELAGGAVSRMTFVKVCHRCLACLAAREGTEQLTSLSLTHGTAGPHACAGGPVRQGRRRGGVPAPQVRGYDARPRACASGALELGCRTQSVCTALQRHASPLARVCLTHSWLSLPRFDAAIHFAGLKAVRWTRGRRCAATRPAC
jgi:hypothetical protein